jgi:outer membrane protein TolC
VGVQATFSPNDVAQAFASAARAKAQVRSIEAQAGGLRDAIDLELQTAYHAVQSADASIETGELELERATESHRVALALYGTGRIASAQLADAEIDLTRARFDVLNARTDARVSRVRLAYALGSQDGELH